MVSLPQTAAAFLLTWASASALALPVNESPAVPEFQDVLWLDPGSEQAGPALPPEVADQLSPRQAASLPEAVLSARSVELRERLAENPGDPYVLHALGTVVFHQGGRREAMALWGAGHRAEPNLAPSDLMAAVHEVFRLLASGDRAGAQAQLAAAEATFAGNAHFQLMRGEQAMRGRNPGAAGQAYREAYRLAPELYVTSLNLARFYDYVGHEPKETGKLFQKATSVAPRRAEVWSSLGTFQFRRNDPEAALTSFGKARSLDPRAPLPERRLGDLSHAADDFPAAAKWYRAALQRESGPAEAQSVRTALGDGLLRLGLYDEARAVIEAALEHQQLPMLVFALGTIDEAQGRLAQAERRYRQTLELMTDHPLAANNLAMVHVKTGQSAAEALSLAERARARLPDNAIVQGTYGCALTANGRHGEAIQTLEPVVNAAPKDVWARYCLGKSLLAEQRLCDARPHLERVLEEDRRFARRAEVERLLASPR